MRAREGRDPTRSPSQPASVLYTNESGLRRPASLLLEVRADLRPAGILAWRLLLRDLRAEYRQSVLGLTWAFLPSILLASAATLASRARVIDVGATDLPYPVYVLLSAALWQTFVEALNGPLRAVTATRSMLARIRFPREAVVLAKVGEVLVLSVPRVVLVGALLAWYRIPIAWTALAAPLALLLLVALGTLVGVVVAPLAALYRDFERGLTLITGFWLLITPVLYPVPEAGGVFALVVRLNPVTPLLVTTRELLTGDGPSHLFACLAVGGATLAGLLVTWLAFRLAMPYVIERAGA
jgi:lipopolysaccharide transport system permease protein